MELSVHCKVKLLSESFVIRESGLMMGYPFKSIENTENLFLLPNLFFCTFTSSCQLLVILLLVMTVPLLISFIIIMLEEFSVRLPKLRMLSSWISGSKTRRNIYICCFITTMSISR